MFILNKITRVLRAPEEAPAATTGTTTSEANALAFTPSMHEQGVGLLSSMKERARAQQAAEEDTGSISIDDNSNGDITKGDESNEEQAIVTKGGEADDTGQLPKKVTEQVAADKPNVEEGAAEEPSGLMYEGIPIEVTNTPEMVAEFTAKGLDIDAVNVELYSKDGLTADTRAKLDEAFGKVAVSMYLQGLDSHNKGMLATHNANQQTSDIAMNKLTEEVTGGKFDEVMSWANTNLNAEEYKQYQTAINSGDNFQVKMALQNLVAQSGLGASLTAPTVKVSPQEQMLSAATVTTETVAQTCTAAEYHAAIVSGEYAKDMPKWDVLRQAGLDAGIG